MERGKLVVKKEYKVFSFIFLLFLLVILASVYVAKQNLTKAYQLPEVAQTQNIATPVQVFPTELRQIKTEAEEKKLEAKTKETEFDLSRIPDSVLEEAEKNQPQEEGQPSERKLNTQPSLQKMKELRARGLIIN